MDKDTRDAIWTTNDCKSYAGSQGLITIMYLVEKKYNFKNCPKCKLYFFTFLFDN